MTWIQTYTGKKFDLLNPSPLSVDIEDLAHALAHQCRFAGHCRRPYSVAEHSYWMATCCVLDSEMVVHALLHDAAEAYTGDIIAPLKRIMDDESLRDIDAKITRCVYEHLAIAPPTIMQHEALKRLDLRMLATEKRDLFDAHIDWPCLDGYAPLPLEIPGEESPTPDRIANMWTHWLNVYIGEVMIGSK